MQLHTRTWGEGDRVALLVHGIMADHRTWRRVGPALADRGFRTIAVDLRGHGLSGRGTYAPADFADDLAETLPTGAALALGHSLGGLALALAAERLRPARAVYADPAWRLFDGRRHDPVALISAKDATREAIAAGNPRWEPADVDTEVATLARWDSRTAFGLSRLAHEDFTPDDPRVPSLVQIPGDGGLVTADHAARLRKRGFTTATLPDTGHTMHRDDFDAFMTALDHWLAGN
ncbi:alpha/beta hydrolase [Streptomyces sp. MP131-18]|uniref:alpha/beta fold hydrolase n=1 Tax=Streptomyces sp. MP131-18 TaxID=1857892 RepID=UPI00097C06F1|nr:alpha/beta hydrolase [Streptomyces sp. MP131-18]ONK11332.1 acetoin dehydrogenase E2 subunit dihydrolipoyllysine-residue acetyltransferase [Streptomyces sp. MP131-18]